MKPVSLEADTKPQAPKRDSQDILGQESVTRFDNVKKRRRKKVVTGMGITTKITVIAI